MVLVPLLLLLAVETKRRSASFSNRPAWSDTGSRRLLSSSSPLLLVLPLLQPPTISTSTLRRNVFCDSSIRTDLRTFLVTGCCCCCCCTSSSLSSFMVQCSDFSNETVLLLQRLHFCFFALLALFSYFMNFSIQGKCEIQSSDCIGPSFCNCVVRFDLQKVI
jgi:hypothetical protein